DATTDDNTIRRIKKYSMDWDYGSLVVVNLYAYRTTYPEELAEVMDPVGPDNDHYIQTAVERSATMVMVAWGTHGTKYISNRVKTVTDIIHKVGGRMHCLGVTVNGSPRHPLRLSKACKPVPWPL